MDAKELQGLLDEAVQAQSVYWDAMRAIERHIGCDLDEITEEEETAITMSAEELIALVEAAE